MEVNGGVTERIERRLDALGLRPEEVDAKVGLPPGTTERLRAGHGPIPGGRFLRGLCAALDTDEAYLLGLEPGDLVPAELLVEPQGEFGLLAPDEEALLKHYRSLSVPLRAAVALLVAKAAGVEEELQDRIAAPIGLDLGAVTPEETALSIMAEVVAVRNGREGGRLSGAGAGRIHEVGA